MGPNSSHWVRKRAACIANEDHVKVQAAHDFPSTSFEACTSPMYLHGHNLRGLALLVHPNSRLEAMALHSTPGRQSA